MYFFIISFFIYKIWVEMNIRAFVCHSIHLRLFFPSFFCFFYFVIIFSLIYIYRFFVTRVLKSSTSSSWKFSFSIHVIYLYMFIYLKLTCYQFKQVAWVFSFCCCCCLPAHSVHCKREVHLYPFSTSLCPSDGSRLFLRSLVRRLFFLDIKFGL